MKQKLTKGIAAVILGGGALLVFARAHRAPKPIDSSALVSALEHAKQPAAASTRLKQAGVAGDRCNYAEVASRELLDADLASLVQGVLNAAPPDCPHAATLLGQRAEAFARAGSKDEAEQTAQTALKAGPQNAFAQLALARVAYDKNQMGSCADYAQKALDYGRGAEAERLLGRSTLARGQFKEAEAHYQKVLSANPNDAEAAFSAAICDDNLGRYMQAREGFLQTLRIDPKHEEARKYLVILTYKAGAKDEARHHLQKYAELVPKDSATLAALERVVSGGDASSGTPDKP